MGQKYLHVLRKEIFTCLEFILFVYSKMPKP